MSLLFPNPRFVASALCRGPKMAAIQLTTTGLPSNEHGFTNCAYVHTEDLKALAANAGVDPERALKRGLLCQVGEGVFLVQ